MSIKQNETLQNRSSIIEKLFVQNKKAHRPTSYQLLVMEQKLREISLPKPLHTYTGIQLLELFHVKLEFENAKNMPKGVLSVFVPTDSTEHNAVLKVSRSVRHNSFFVEEAATFLLNMEEDGKIRQEIARLSNEEETSQTLKRDCLARMMIIPKSTIDVAINQYSKLKSPEEKADFIDALAKEYKTTASVILNRMRDARRMNAAGAFVDYKASIKRLDFLKEAQELADPVKLRQAIRPKKS